MNTKKSPGRKLMLSRETLRHLSETELRGALGGLLSAGDSCRFCDSSSPDCTATHASCHCSEPCTSTTC